MQALQSHIRREYEALDRNARHAANEREHQADLAANAAIAARNADEDAYTARCAAAMARGLTEEEFEAREEAAQIAQYRVIEFANAAILDVFRRAA